jgi:hypothetical protein
MFSTLRCRGCNQMHAALLLDEGKGLKNAELRQCNTEMLHGRPRPSLFPVVAASLASRLLAGAACNLTVCQVQEGRGRPARHLYGSQGELTTSHMIM